MKNKLVAVLFAFFLGGIGVHKFYLGNNFSGVLYLIFFWTFIPSLLAFFDFLGLLLMTEQAFNGKYNNAYLPTPRLSYPLPQTVDLPVDSKRLDVKILKICRQPNGATVSDCIIATEESPDKVKKTIETLYKQELLTIENRLDGAIIYRSI
jgi:TM2 domain-containing membrane protein YozV